MSGAEFVRRSRRDFCDATQRRKKSERSRGRREREKASDWLDFGGVAADWRDRMGVAGSDLGTLEIQALTVSEFLASSSSKLHDLMAALVRDNFNWFESLFKASSDWLKEIVDPDVVLGFGIRVGGVFSSSSQTARRGRIGGVGDAAVREGDASSK
jgi:hypothetical protein